MDQFVASLRRLSGHNSRLLSVITGRTGYLGRREREQAQPVLFHDVLIYRQRGSDHEQGCTLWQGRDMVSRPGCADQERARHGPVPGVKRQGLLWQQAPVCALDMLEIARAERPECGIPSRALIGRLIRAGGNVPALDRFLQEAVSQHALPMGSRELARVYGHHAMTLKRMERFHGCRQFFGRCYEDRLSVRLSRRGMTRFMCRIRGRFSWRAKTRSIGRLCRTIRLYVRCICGE